MAPSEVLWPDSDVILDWLADRQPWTASATEVIRRAVLGHWKLWFSPLTLANVHYLYRKQAGSAKALSAIHSLERIGHIAAMNASHVRQAIISRHSDFEDELQMACATNVAGIAAIITRNLSDYAHSPITAMTAEAWLAQHPES